MTRYKFPSIKDKGGLAVHLNESKPLHRGFGYKTYKILRTAKLNVSSRAKAFNVTFTTMKEWDHIDDREALARKEAADKAVEQMK